MALRERGRTDGYAVSHADGESVVTWEHERDEARTYRVTLADGAPAGCTCPAAKYGRHCRHRAATAVIVRKRWINTEAT